MGMKMVMVIRQLVHSFQVLQILHPLQHNILLFNVIDPDAAIRLKELTLESTVQMLEKFGTPTSAIKETVDKMKDYNQFSTIEQLNRLTKG